MPDTLDNSTTQTLGMNLTDAATFSQHIASFEDMPWLQELKTHHWEQYNQLPDPDRSHEAWRFAKLPKLDPKLLHAAPEPEEKELEELKAKSQLVHNNAGTLILADNYLIEHQPVSDELAAKGVIWKPLWQAFRDHPDLLKAHFLKEGAKLGSEKFFALHAAYCGNGAFLYVPKGVEIEQPFIAYHWAHTCKTAFFPHTLVIAEDNANVSLADYYGSSCDDCDALVVGVGTVHGGNGSKVFRKYVQDFSEHAHVFQIENTIAARDSQIQNVAVNIGAQSARFENHVDVAGAGADVKLYSLTVANNKQQFDQRTMQTHSAPNAFSDLLYKNALLDDSKTIFSGLIRVDEIAQQTDAYQTNRNLLLSDKAEAVSLPGLEIEANDVKCSHGATTGKLDESELFYMLTRGLSRDTARQLLIFGFFEEILQKIEHDELADNVRQMVQRKFTRGSKD